MHTLLFGLPGLSLLFQGEEPGLQDGRVRLDKHTTRLARSPVSTPPAGTPPGRRRRGRPILVGASRRPSTIPWLTFGERSDAETAQVQDSDPRSTLASYRRLLAARRTLTEAGVLTEPVRWLSAAGGVLAYQRGHVLVTANATDS